MTARPGLRRYAFLGVVGFLACWITALPGAASTAPGDVTRIGGQGAQGSCDDDNLPFNERGDDGRAGIGSAKFYDSSFVNIRSLAVDGSGTKVFVPDRTVVRGVNGYVAGVPPRDPPSSSTTSSTFFNEARLGLTGPAAEGADAKAVRLAPLAVAVDSKAQNLYILEPTSVRQVNLQEAVPTIHTVAGEAAGTPLKVGTSSVIAADIYGRVFIGDSASGAVYRLNTVTGDLAQLTTLSGKVGSLTVDAGGTALYAAEFLGSTVKRIDPVTGATTVVAGGGASNQDGVAATSASLVTEAIAVDPLGGHLYISDDVTHRIRKVDLSNGIIQSVVGSGQEGYQDQGKAASFSFLEAQALAVDLFGNVFMLIADHCAIFRAETPAVIFTPPPPSTPTPPQPPPTTPTGPTGQDATDTGSQTAPETVGGNQAPQQGGSPGSQSSATPGDNGIAGQPTSELRIIDQGNAPAASEGVAQPAVEQVPTPSPTVQFSPAPAATPTPTPVADSGTGAASFTDPVPSAAAAADASPAAPPAPAAAPVPPAPASAPPPAAQEPVSNVGLAHGDSAAPTRGATKYAMVRNDDEQPVAALAMAGAGGLLAMFLCVLFVAPGASSKPKPRPRRAY